MNSLPTPTKVTLVFNTGTEGESTTLRAVYLDDKQAKAECGGYNFETGWGIIGDSREGKVVLLLKGSGWAQPAALPLDKDMDREHEEAVAKAKAKLDEKDLKALGLKR